MGSRGYQPSPGLHAVTAPHGAGVNGDVQSRQANLSQSAYPGQNIYSSPSGIPVQNSYPSYPQSGPNSYPAQPSGSTQNAYSGQPSYTTLRSFPGHSTYSSQPSPSHSSFAGQAPAQPASTFSGQPYGGTSTFKGPSSFTPLARPSAFTSQTHGAPPIPPSPQFYSRTDTLSTNTSQAGKSEASSSPMLSPCTDGPTRPVPFGSSLYKTYTSNAETVQSGGLPHKYESLPAPPLDYSGGSSMSTSNFSNISESNLGDSNVSSSMRIADDGSLVETKSLEQRMLKQSVTQRTVEKRTYTSSSSSKTYQLDGN